ncbi:MFS transporter [Arenibaculum pallidiluteum]|uniref:MFS transporter n=1 Tax=Arenibaculum pallidiluteum TaxID=2812559 RepID=UPI001A968B0A|nr:MFS transporter [Arenibaculum pallidiluteum]
MTGAAVPPAIDGPGHRAMANVIRLAVAQALGGANATVLFATGAIVGSTLAPDPAYATVPLSVFVVGMALGTLPAGWIARQHGRRAAFLTGAGCGVAAGLVGALAILWGAFALFCVATLLGGLYAAVVQSFRFAAADGAGPAFRPKALSWVMAGGIFAGVLGPQLVNLTMNLWAPHLFAASYLGQAAAALLSMAVLSGVDLPKPVTAARSAGRPLAEIARQPAFVAAVLCGAITYALMNLVMTSAPLAMRMCGLPITDSNLAIQWHVIAMYGPSFFTGSLIARFGARPVVATGLAITAAAAATGLAGISVWHFWTALILLGIGWNLGFVGASALVLETHRPEERHKVQSFNDFLVFGTMAVGSFSSGQLLAGYGWDAVNWVTLPPILLAFAALAAIGRRRPAAVRTP